MQPGPEGEPHFIAIVGGSDTNSLTPEIVANAEITGCTVAQKGGIVVTGGAPSVSAPEALRPVKTAAMDGAHSMHSRDSLVTYGVAVLPKRKPCPQHDTIALATNLTSSERNLITARLADAMIAFEGGGGTGSEIAFAVYYGKPVLIVDLSGEELAPGALPGWLASIDNTNGRDYAAWIDNINKACQRFGVNPTDVCDAFRAWKDAPTEPRVFPSGVLAVLAVLK